MDDFLAPRESMMGEPATPLSSLPHVLAVDDDASTRALVADYLGRNDFRVTTVATGAECAAVLERETVDILLLDLRLSGEDGLGIARRVRAQAGALGALPILMLTGRTEEADRVMGLELGADDYLTKPFSPRELVARIRALLRRARARVTVAEEIARVRGFRFGDWELSIGLRKLKRRDDQPVDLTNGEFSLLTAFLASPRRVLTREQLLDLSRLHNAEVYDRSIDVQILRLRRKIEPDPVRPTFIRTMRGAGYVFDCDVEVMR